MANRDDKGCSVRVEVETELVLPERVVNALRSAMNNSVPLANSIIVSSGGKVKIVDDLPRYALSNYVMEALLSSRGFFSVGLSFIHPITGCECTELVKFGASLVRNSEKERCYQGSSRGLFIHLPQRRIADVQNTRFKSEEDGCCFTVETYTPVLFD